MLRITKKTASRLLRVCAGVAVAPTAITGAANSEPVFGYLDPATNLFTPAPATGAAPSAATPAGAPIVRKGTLVVVVNVAFGASVPPSAAVQALVQAQTVPVTGASPAYSSGLQGQESVVRSGATGSARIQMPYAWTVSSASDTVVLTMTLRSSTGESADVSQTLSLPAVGATTTITISQRLGG